MDTLKIISTNYSGQTAVVTYYPDTGGTINIGTVVLPYDYVAPYFYGTYSLFFPAFGSTCTLYVEDESGNFLLQENGDYIFQENYYKIEIEGIGPSPTPTPSITPSLSATPSVTPTPSITPSLSVTPTITPSRTPSVTPSLSNSKRILFLGDGNVTTVASNVSNYLTATGNPITYSAVTMSTTYSGNGITTLNYDAVVYYTNSSQIGNSALSTNLLNYVNSGGNLITGVFSWNLYPSGFSHTGLTAFNVTNSQSNNSTGNFTVSTPSVITNGIGTSFGGTVFTNSNPTLVAGSTLLASYSSDSVRLLATRQVGSAKLVSINTWFASINSSGSTLTKMVGNSILYATNVLVDPTPTPTPTQSVTPSITPSITPTRSVTPTPTLTPTPTSYGQTFIYYRWQITESKTMPPNANCVQSSEFVFQKNGVDQSMSGVVVTNPSGNNPVGEEPSKLIDGSLTTKALDLNFVTNGNVTNFIFQFPTGQAFDGYRWGTANDEESRDPKSWTISGSNDGVNWTLLHTVTGFNATTTRNVYQTPQTYLPPAVSPTPTVTNTPTPTRTPSVTPTPSSSSIVSFVTDSLFMKLDATNYTSGTWSDETGNGNNATINGATWLSTDGGIFDLDGTNDTISVPHVSQLSLTTTGQKTVQVWVKFDALPSSGQQVPVFGKLSSASGFDGYWGGLFSNTGTVRCVTNGTGVQQVSTSTLTITTNTWYLFTFISQITATANTTKVYINNTEYITTAHGADSYGETNPFYLGWIGSGVSSPYLNGKIGACYFYTKGLNTTEISNNYNSTKSKYGL